MNLLSRLLWLLTVGGGSILVDQLTKQVASQTLSPLLSSLYLDGMLRLIYAENTGIMQSVGSHLPQPVKDLLFTLLPALLFLTLLVYVLLSRQKSRLDLMAFSLLIGGGLSNVIDRLLHDGAVIDFIYVVLWGRMTGIFNLADLAISAGCTILILQALNRRGFKRSQEHGSR